MSRLFIDCEWNDYQGELISIAIVSECGREFYEVLGCPNPTAWVKENVLPVLNKTDFVSLEVMRQSLYRYLSKFPEIHVIADWPEDIARFCQLLITGPGERLNTPPLTMEIVRLDTASAIPHNALEDAKALREAVLKQEEMRRERAFRQF